MAGDEDDVLLDDSPFIVPDVELRWRVTGQRGSEEEFRTLGRQSAEDLARAIRPIADDGWRDTCFPAFYHSAFHAPGYVFEHWGEFFEIVAYYPRGALGFQDIVVCRRP